MTPKNHPLMVQVHSNSFPTHRTSKQREVFTFCHFRISIGKETTWQNFNSKGVPVYNTALLGNLAVHSHSARAQATRLAGSGMAKPTPGLDDFESLRVLGKGSYGKVFLVRRSERQKKRRSKAHVCVCVCVCVFVWFVCLLLV